MSGGYRRSRAVRIRVLVLAGLAGTAPAMGATWRITPSLAVAETLTDNVTIAPDAQKQSDLITEITPGIRIDGTGGRVKLNLDFQRSHIFYANVSEQNRAQNYLNATASVEAVQNWLFIDANASISQQSISAFGAQPTSVSNANVNANRAETRTYQISPYIRGRFSPTTDYQLRYRWTSTSTRGQIGDGAFDELTGNITGGTRIAALGWALDTIHQRTHYDTVADTEFSRLRGSLTYQFNAQFQVLGTAGYETNNYSGVDDSGSTYGVGFNWGPTERTQISALREKRIFGNSHNFSVRHRTPRTAWRFSDTEDATTTPNRLAIVDPGTAFNLMFDALATEIPDPVARKLEVERRLAASGTPADLVQPQTALTVNVFKQRAREFSVAFLGVNNTVTITGTVIDTHSLTSGGPATDDLSRSPGIEQRGLTADWAHRISALTSLNVLASRIESKSTSVAGLESTQSIVRVLLTRQLSPKAYANLGARIVRFDAGSEGGTNDYREKALTASLVLTF